MKPFRKLTAKYPFLKILGNRYVLILLLFAVWMLFIDNYSLYFDHPVLDKKIEELEENKEYYIQEIKKDSTSIKHLKNPEQTEKYAREKYYMKKENEDIYIIEFENDSANGEAKE